MRWPTGPACAAIARDRPAYAPIMDRSAVTPYVSAALALEAHRRWSRHASTSREARGPHASDQLAWRGVPGDDLRCQGSTRSTPPACAANRCKRRRGVGQPIEATPDGSMLGLLTSC